MEIDLILKESSWFGGKIYSGLPPAGVLLGARDVVLLQKWNAQDLLNLARTQICQVSIFAPVQLSETLSPFYDWCISEVSEFESLEKKSQGYPISSKQINKDKSASKAALFLDRDGVVNVDHGYVGEPRDVELIPHIGQLISKANHAGREVIIVTNQSGIGRGYYSESSFNSVMNRIKELLDEDKARVDWIEHSSFHPNSEEEKFRWGRQFRKPRPGMLHQAAQSRNIDLRHSVMIGDHVKDLMTATLAGVGHIYLLATEEAESIQKSFKSWIRELEDHYRLNALMQGIEFQVISGLDEAKLWS